MVPQGGIPLTHQFVWFTSQIAVNGLMDASMEDGDTIVWIVRALYSMPALKAVFDVTLLGELRTVREIIT